MNPNLVSLLTRRTTNRRFNQTSQSNWQARAPRRRGQLLVYVGLVLILAVLLGNIGSLSTSASKGTGRSGAADPESPSTAGQHQGMNSIAAVLNEDGTIQPGANGSFDVSGFSMQYGPNGAPLFVPQASCGTPDWDGQFGLNGTNDTVWAMTVSGNTIFVGGSFTAIGNVAANHVAKFDTTTNTWSALSQHTIAGDVNGVNKIVFALAVSGNSLFVGGDFTTAGTNVIVFANGVAKFDLSTNTWSALKQGNGNGVSNFVQAMAVSGNSLYVGGGFSSVNFGGTGATPAILANNMAKFDTSTNTWSALSQGNGNGVNSQVFALAVTSNSLFVGGAFTFANQGGTGATPAITANFLAKFDTSANTWSTVSQGNGNGLSGGPYALAIIGNSLFVGGGFFSVNQGGTGATPAIPVNRIAKFDIVANTWSAVSQGNGNGVSDFSSPSFSISGSVQALAVSGNSLFVGGFFNQVNQGGTGATPAITAHSVAKFDTSTNTWSALSQGNGAGIDDGGLWALALSGNSVFAGGEFNRVNSGGTGGTPTILSSNIARFDTSTNTWSALAASATANGVNNAVRALVVSGNNLFIGGDFNFVGTINPVAANRVAKFDTTTNTWSGLSQGNGNGVNNTVRALAVIGGSLFAGGDFTTANLGGTGATPAITANRVAKFDTATNTWSALSQGNGNGVNQGVEALAVIGNSLFVGGSFLSANSGGTGATPAIIVNGVAKFDTNANTWSALKQGNGNGVDGFVHALAVSGNSLFVGGDSTTANQGGTGATPAITAINVAKFDTATNTWSALAQGNGNGVNNAVFALAATGSSIFAGGDFTTVNFGGSGATPAITVNRVAKFDTSTGTWSALSQGNGNGVNGTVLALAVSDTSVFAGGTFTTANLGGTGATPAINAKNVAKFDTIANTWTALTGSGGGNGVSQRFTNPTANSFVNTLAVKDCDLFVGGDFFTADNKASANIARYGAPNATPATPTVQFGASLFTVGEGDGFKTITVERTGNTSSAMTVDYLSSDHSNPADFISCTSPGAGLASSRCDFTTAVGTLRFAAGETSKTFDVLISQDNYVEGDETLDLTLSNPTGGIVLGTPATTTLRITDDATEPPTNYVDVSSAFVRSQYHDFLKREPDAPGLAFWTDNIEKCNDASRRPVGQTVAQCIDKQRESTAVAFFMSPEFQITGGFVYHLYKGSLTGSPNYDGGSPGRFPTSLEFMRDVATVSEGIVVNNAISGAVVEANRNRLAAEFVLRPEFQAKYGALNNTLYVQELFNTTGITATPSEKQALVDGLTGGTETKASVLRKVVDGTVVISESNVQFTTTYGQAFINQENRRVFVYMEYIGYLRRNPDAPGFIFWLGKLNFYNGDPFQAEMVRAFILSPEYRSRFGQP